MDPLQNTHGYHVKRKEERKGGEREGQERYNGLASKYYLCIRLLNPSILSQSHLPNDSVSQSLFKNKLRFPIRNSFIMPALNQNWGEVKISHDNRDVKTNWKQNILEGGGNTHQIILKERKSEEVAWLLPKKGAEPKMGPFIFAQTQWLQCLLSKASSAWWFVNFNIQLCIAMGYQLCTRLPTVNILRTNKDWCREQIMLYNFKMKT